MTWQGWLLIGLSLIPLVISLYRVGAGFKGVTGAHGGQAAFVIVVFTLIQAWWFWLFFAAADFDLLGGVPAIAVVVISVASYLHGIYKVPVGWKPREAAEPGAAAAGQATRAIVVRGAWILLLATALGVFS